MSESGIDILTILSMMAILLFLSLIIACRNLIEEKNTIKKKYENELKEHLDKFILFNKIINSKNKEIRSIREKAFDDSKDYLDNLLRLREIINDHKKEICSANEENVDLKIRLDAAMQANREFFSASVSGGLEMDDLKKENERLRNKKFWKPVKPMKRSP